MSFAVLSPAFRGLQFPFRDMFALTFHLNSFTGNNGRPSYNQVGEKLRYAKACQNKSKVGQALSTKDTSRGVSIQQRKHP